MRAISIIYRSRAGRVPALAVWLGDRGDPVLIDGILFQGFAMTGREAVRDRPRALLQLRERHPAVRRRAAVVPPAVGGAPEPLHGAAQHLADPGLGDRARKFFAALTFLTILLALSFYMPVMIKVNGKIIRRPGPGGLPGPGAGGRGDARDRAVRSALTRQQLVAAVASAAMVAIMCFIHLPGRQGRRAAQGRDQRRRPVVDHFQYGFMKAS